MVSSASGSTGSGSGAPITFGGLASGIDTNSIIDAVIAQAKRPITLATAKQTAYKAKQAALAQIKNSLSALLGTIGALATPTTFNTRSSTVLADSANTGKLEAVAGNSATPGSAKIDILSLATAT